MTQKRLSTVFLSSFLYSHSDKYAGNVYTDQEVRIKNINHDW